MHNRFRTLVARATGLSPAGIAISLRQPLDHQSNLLYDVRFGARHLILKEYRKPHEFAEAPVREFRALELLEPLDIAPSPILIQAAPDPPLGPVVVYEFMEGSMWDRQCPTASDLAALAEVWLRLHAVEKAGLWFSRGYEHPLTEIWARLCIRLQQHIARIRTASVAGREIADLCTGVLDRCGAAAHELAALTPPLCFCRADARFANVIQRPEGRLGLVDWEDSGLRDPAREVADLLTHPNQEDLLAPDEWQAFLQPYLAGQWSVDPQLQQRLHLYLAIFPLYWLAILLDQGTRLAAANRLVGWTVNGLPANVRLRRYLARALAWPDADFRAQLATLDSLDFFPSPPTS